jgi:hypothetical protein
LRAIAVVHIPIDDQDSFERVFISRNGSGNRNVVKEAKPHRPVRQRMMPGRPYQAHRRFRLARYHTIDRIAGRSRGERRDIVRCRANQGIGVCVPATSGRECRHSFQMSRVVHSLNPLARRGLPTWTSAVRGKASVFKPGHGRA